MGQGSLKLRSFSITFTTIICVALCAGCGGTGSSAISQLAGGGGTPTQPLPPLPTPPTPVPVPPPTPTVPPPSPGPAPTVSLTASTGTVVAGQLVTLTWTTSNAVSISFSPTLPDAEDRQLTLPTGSATFPLNQTTTYVATVTNASGTQAASSAAIRVLPVQLAFSAEPDTIQAGQSATLTWTSEGLQSLSIDNGIGNVSSLLPDGSMTVSPGVTTTYTATATDDSGAKLTQQVVVSVAVAPPPPQHPIRHIIFMLQENRTFDNYFGALGAYRASRIPGASASDVDGFDPGKTLQTKTGKSVRPYHYQTV